MSLLTLLFTLCPSIVHISVLSHTCINHDSHIVSVTLDMCKNGWEKITG